MRGRQWLGLAVAAVGMALVGFSRAGAAQLLPYVLVLLAALGLGPGQPVQPPRQAAQPAAPGAVDVGRRASPDVRPLAGCLEGPTAIGDSLSTSLTPEALPAWIGLAYTVLIGTVLGSGIWTWLLARHPAGVVGPFSMLVPVVGMATAALALDEIPSVLEGVGGVIVVTGVLIGALNRTARPRRGDAAAVVPEPAPLVGADQR